MAANAVAAVAVANIAGEGTAAPLRALAEFGASEVGVKRPGLVEPKPLLLVDESYNANLASMAAALEVYRQVQPPGGRKVLVLGDMLELGVQSGPLHASLKDSVISAGADMVFLVGPSMASLARALEDEGIEAHAQSVEELSETIVAGLAYGDSIMIKGSKGVRLAGLVQAIRDRFK